MFFARSRSTECLPVGVHAGARGVRMIQLRATTSDDGARHLRGLGLAVAARHAAFDAEPGTSPTPSVPNHAAVAAPSIRQSLRRGGFAGSEIVTALPPGVVHLRTFRLAPAPPAGREAALRRQAREGAPFGDADPVHVDVLCVGEARQGRDVREEFISLTARDADVRACLDAVGRGVTVRSLQAEPFALYRSVAGAAVCEETGATHAVAHVGETETLVLIGAGPQLRVVRRVELGGTHFDRAVARKLSVTPAEARRLRRRARAEGGDDAVRDAIDDATRLAMEDVAREAAMCVRYHAVSFRGAIPKSVRLLGGDATDPQLTSLLAASTGLPVDSRSVFAGIDGWTGDDDGGWAVALGLALTFAPAITPAATPASDIGPVAPAAAELVREATCA